MQSYQDLLITSAPRMFLSLLATFLLIFSGFLVLCSLPSRRSTQGVFPRPVMIVMLGGLVLPPLLNLIGDFIKLRAPAFLFIYTSPGPPPPYSYVIFPILIAVAMLMLASRLIIRVES